MRLNTRGLSAFFQFHISYQVVSCQTRRIHTFPFLKSHLIICLFSAAPQEESLKINYYSFFQSAAQATKLIEKCNLSLFMDRQIRCEKARAFRTLLVSWVKEEKLDHSVNFEIPSPQPLRLRRCRGSRCIVRRIFNLFRL